MAFRLFGAFRLHASQSRDVAVEKAAPASRMRSGLFSLGAPRVGWRQLIREAFRRDLAAEFASDVEWLERFLGRSLSMCRERDRFSHLTEEGAIHQPVGATQRQERKGVINDLPQPGGAS